MAGDQRFEMFWQALSLAENREKRTRSFHRRRNAPARWRPSIGGQIESLEAKLLLTGTPGDEAAISAAIASASESPSYVAADTQSGFGSVNLAIYINREQVNIPANVGVGSDGLTADTYTSDASGKVFFDATTGLVSLGAFFDVWREAAGLAGNNSAATLTASQLMGNAVDRTHTLQLFVNGHLSLAADQLLLHDGDQITLVYGADPVVSLNTNFGSILVDLYAAQTPGTVANFLNYVNGGDYIDSFFHRSVEDFVIQGGGFYTDSTTFTDTTQFDEIFTGAPIANEPGISNLRGTIAMAKLGGDPDSATSQFFVNLSDDNTFLDSAANNAFTVFGKILGMSTVDTIAALPINTDHASPFDELPLSATNQLATIESIDGQGTIAGVEYRDANSSGSLDAGDSPIAGVTIYLDTNGNGAFDGSDLATTTAADGSYFFHVAPGTYTVRSLGAGGQSATTPASRTATVEIGRETSGLNFGELALTAPTGVALTTSSDTGTAGDNLTNLNNNSSSATLQFTVSGVTPGAQVFLYADGTLIGSATAALADVIVTTSGTVSLADGPQSITAVQSLSGVNSSASAAISIAIDTAPPAPITTTPPQYAQIGQSFSYDADSLDESLFGMSYSLLGAPAGMTIDSSGVVHWTPTADQALPQHVQIILSDAAGNHVAQSLDLTVLGIIPAFSDSYTVNEDDVIVIDAASGVLANDGSESELTLTAAVIAQPAHGAVSFNGDGSFTYTPNANFFGVDRFTYTATDGVDTSNVAEVTVSVTAQDDPPVGLADSYTTSEDVPLTISASAGVLANDTDIDGDSLSASLASSPSHGTLTLHADGSFVYTPDANFSGDDSFSYTLSDGVTNTGPLVVDLHITAVNDAPTANADSYTVNEDGVLTVDAVLGVLANDGDLDSSSLTALLIGSTAHGTISLSGDGSFTYTPAANFFGTDSFSYVVSDGSGQSQTATATISVTAMPDAPTATDDNATAPNDGTVQAIDVLVNDTSEPDGAQTLSIISITQGTAGGVVAINGNSINYTGPLNYTGADTFTYTIQDADGLTSTATVSVTVADQRVSSLAGYVYIDANHNAVCDDGEARIPGVKVTLTGTDNQGAAVSQDAITDTDGYYHFADLKAGTYQIVEQQPAALTDGNASTTLSGAVAEADRITNIVLAAGADLTDNNFGESGLRPQFINVLWFLASTPPQSVMLRNTVAVGEELAGNADLANAIRAGLTTMSASSTGASASSIVAAQSLPATTQSPVAAADHYALNQDETLSINAALGLLANDAALESLELTAVLTSEPMHGTLSLASDGSFMYVPESGYSGDDRFAYRASDESSTSLPVEVSLTIRSTRVDAFLTQNLADEAFAGKNDWLT